MSRLRADLLLLTVSIIWGTAFIAQKHANDSMGPVSFVGARFLLSWAAVAPLAFYEHYRLARTRLNHAAFRRTPAFSPRALQNSDLALAGLIGLCLFIGSALQQIGLVTTTATNAGFLTALYVVFVPFIVWMITGAQPRPIVLIAVVASVAGAWLLTEQGHFHGWTAGDPLMLIADIAWAAGISLVPIFLSRADRPFFLAFAQYGVAAALGLACGLRFEPFSREGLALALPAILYAGLCSGGIAYTLQIFAQKYTPPAEAALIMSLESVFAALAGAALLSERLTGRAVLGCALILLGVVSVEAGPAIRNFKLRDRLRKAFLDRAAFRRNRLNADNAIDSKGLERAPCEKPVPAFSQRALAPRHDPAREKRLGNLAPYEYASRPTASSQPQGSEPRQKI